MPGQVSAGMRAHRSEPLKSSFVPSRRRSPSCLRDSDPSTPALRANPCPEVTDPFGRLPLPTRQSVSPPNNVRPRKLRCRCRNEFEDFVLRRNSTYNQFAYETCRDCFLSKKPPKAGRKSVAANNPVDRSPNSSQTREIRVSAARIARTNAKVCGQTLGHACHPRLEVLLLFATPKGRREFKVKDAVPDSGAQIMIVPAHLLSRKGIACTGLRQSHVDLRSANNVKMDVQGVTDVTISALSPSGERFSATTTA